MNTETRNNRETSRRISKVKGLHRNSRRPFPVTVLLSGGVDSTACVSFYLEHGYAVEGMFVDYGQISAKKELSSARSISRSLGVKLKCLKWAGKRTKGSGLIWGRNAFLIFATLMEITVSPRILAIGVHSGTMYSDCSPRFIRTMQSVIDAYTDGRVQLGTPFLDWKKADIWNFCEEHNIPIHLTYSCEKGLKQPCGSCLSCKDLEILNARS